MNAFVEPPAPAPAPGTLPAPASPPAPGLLPKRESANKSWARALDLTSRGVRDPSRTLPAAAMAWSAQYGDRLALIGDREQLTFAELARRINQYARWALVEGIAKGETVALVMRNRPEYFALWMGLTHVGVVAALISPDLESGSLAHAFRVAGATRAIVAPDLADECGAALATLGRYDLWTCGEGFSRRPIEDQIAANSGDMLSLAELRDVTLSDRALRIFTSGTTGFPKAAEVSHRKIISWTHWFAGLANLGPEDRLYNCLPMHHSVGGVLAMGAPLVRGGSVAIAEKFSASRFFDDVVRFDCTAFQYIGELCRYLSLAPPSAAEARSRLRLAIGNGLAPDVWGVLAARWPQIQVLEFYASTEGNVWLYNVEGRVGAVGRAPSYLAAREGLALVRFDEEAQAPWRGTDGFCARSLDGEAGEALGRIGGDEASRFEGYSQDGETEKKILRDVFALGDAWMRTGDLLRRDADGFYAFVDRIGDTFRWKGENVATADVVAALSRCAGIAEAIVFGVAVPHSEGRAGMAVVTANGAPDLEGIARAVAPLPRYARPLFLRFVREIARTETFKPKRALYAAEGFDPGQVGDPLYILVGDGYVPLDLARYASILAGVARL